MIQENTPKPVDASELQWPDFAPGLAQQLYSETVLKLFGKEWEARTRKAASGHPKLTPLEQIQLAMTASVDPEGSLKYKGGRSPITRKLDTYAHELTTEGKKLSRIGALLQIEKTKSIIDQTLCNVLIIGVIARRREKGEPCEDVEVFRETKQIIERAVTTVSKLSSDPTLTGLGLTKTGWRSLFEQLVRADVFESYKPLIITSTGGTAEAHPNAASAANILPALKLARTLREAGYEPRVLGSFASEFAIECNAQDPEETRKNQRITEDLYRACVEEFFPDLHSAGVVSFETPPVSELQTKIPKDYVEFTRQAMKNPEPLGQEFATLCNSLLTTAGLINGKGEIADEERFENTLTYLLSHQLIFRDVQQGDGIQPFVIKVGAPSEDRFSRFQQIITEAYMNHKGRTDSEMIPNATHHAKAEAGKSWEYGQITLFYPKMGERPVYYPEKTGEKKNEDELDIFQLAADPKQNGFASMKMSMDASIQRYAALESLLAKMGVSPDKYIKVVREVAKKHASDSLAS